MFEQVGIEILKNAWEGYHCCLFAYGQTGAGKSYSMVGYGSNKVNLKTLRVSFPSAVRKFSIESHKTMMPIENTRSMYR